MRQAALTGTGSAVDGQLLHSRALVKTGTAKCTHHDGSPGDGFTVALVPVEDPQFLLLVRVHGVPGAQAAFTAGEMLRDVGE
jgi:cell division protein FtsI/penicillin-binding protein 2